MAKKLCLFSGGMDSLAIVLEYIEKYGKENVITLGFQYGQRHFLMENSAANCFCADHDIKRIVLDVPIWQINQGRSLTDKNVDVTTDMNNQRSTVVNFRNTLFTIFAAGVAIQNGCDEITLGVCKEDYGAYRDTREIFFRLLQYTIQAGMTDPRVGSEFIEHDIQTKDGSIFIPDSKLDIKISTPLMFESKAQTMARILTKHPIDIYKYSYSCYKGGSAPCMVCPACVERAEAFRINNVKDPLINSP